MRGAFELCLRLLKPHRLASYLHVHEPLPNKQPSYPGVLVIQRLRSTVLDRRQQSGGGNGGLLRLAITTPEESMYIHQPPNQGIGTPFRPRHMAHAIGWAAVFRTKSTVKLEPYTISFHDTDNVSGPSTGLPSTNLV